MKADVSPSMLRAQWLADAEQALRMRFKEKGYDVDAQTRTSIGFPKGTRDSKMAIGQCWAIESSADGHWEMFISPELGHSGKRSLSSSIQILGVLAHEIAHTVAGTKAGHRIRKRPDTSDKDYDKRFAKWRMTFPAVAEAVGLIGPWTATTEGPDFTIWAKAVVEKIGLFPAGALTKYDKKKTDKNRQRKCSCEKCGYIARTTRKWIEAAGPPICPTDKTIMACDDGEDGEGDDD